MMRISRRSYGQRGETPEKATETVQKGGEPTSMLLVAAQPRAEYHAPGEHDARGDRPPIAVVGSTTREVFEAYIERSLLPTLRPGQIVVMDNLAAHKSERVRKLIEAQEGCELLYLPPYSPDFNPIEEACSKVKGSLRKAAARTRRSNPPPFGRSAPLWHRHLVGGGNTVQTL
jgi:transposase